MMTPKEVIHAEYGSSKNFMTPDILKTGWCGKLRAFELSRGQGILGGSIYGVTVVQLREDGTTEKCSNLSKMFSSRADAREHIAELSGDA